MNKKDKKELAKKMKDDFTKNKLENILIEEY